MTGGGSGSFAALPGRIGEISQRAVASMNRHHAAILGLYLIALVSVIASQASARPFWHDEIFTLAVSALPSVRDIWTAQLDGLDLSPPLNAVLTHHVSSVLGSGPVVSRIPPIAGFAVMCGVVFEIVRRRSNVPVALTAAVVPVFSGAGAYATEARAYGLMVGLFALALLAWSEAAAGRRRRIYLPVLAVAVGAGVWNHYFAVLVAIPIGVGELVRMLQTRRPDVGILGSVGVGLLAALPLKALADRAAEQAPTFWRSPEPMQLAESFRLIVGFLTGRRFLLLFALVAIVIAVSPRRVARQAAESLRGYEIAAGCAVLLLPLWAFLLGVAVTGVFVPRYAVAGAVGLAVMAPLALHRVARANSTVDLLICAGFLAALLQFSLVETASARGRDAGPLQAHPVLVEELRAGHTVAVTGHLFAEAWHYAPEPLRARLVYLAEPDIALQRSGSNTLDLGYSALARWRGAPVADYRDFVAGHPAFRVYAGGWFTWLPAQLAADGASVERIGSTGEFTLLDVSVPCAVRRRLSSGSGVRCAS